MSSTEKETEVDEAWRREWANNYPGPETSKSAHKKGFTSGHLAAKLSAGKEIEELKQDLAWCLREIQTGASWSDINYVERMKRKYGL